MYNANPAFLACKLGGNVIYAKPVGLYNQFILKVNCSNEYEY